jgi:hypothetical protein
MLSISIRPAHSISTEEGTNTIQELHAITGVKTTLRSDTRKAGAETKLTIRISTTTTRKTTV